MPKGNVIAAKTMTRFHPKKTTFAKLLEIKGVRQVF